MFDGLAESVRGGRYSRRILSDGIHHTMTSLQHKQYLDDLAGRCSDPFFIQRRFSAATTEGGSEPDLGSQFRGVSRDREPDLQELLKHLRVLVLGEPGMGKSAVARAAVRAAIQAGERVPLYAELKQYRSNSGLAVLLGSFAPAPLLADDVEAEGKRLLRTYVLDGVDEIPAGHLIAFGKDLDNLIATESPVHVVITARQAFYVANRGSLPQFRSVFHILDFSDDDIREYVNKKGADYESFAKAVDEVGATDEIRNPLVLSAMLELFSQAGKLGETRSANLSFVISRLIESRLQIDPYRRRRALGMLAVEMETYCRNELTEPEAIQIIRASMHISEPEAGQLLQELYGSILRQTLNGFTFQMRSFGEYLAAEALDRDSFERLRELAFIDNAIPNESWMNCVSYLAEINPDVRRVFAGHYPSWMLSSSPAPFSEAEKEQVVRGVLEASSKQGMYIYGRPETSPRRLARFLTLPMEAELIRDLESPDDPTRANALLTMSYKDPYKVERKAIAVLSTQSEPESLRLCAIFALINSANPNLVPELLPLLDAQDPLDSNILDLIGALCSEDHLLVVLPLIAQTRGMLSNAFYHFREFNSRKALLATLRYFIANPNQLRDFNLESYVEPVLKLIRKYFDGEIAAMCAHIVHELERHKSYLTNSDVGSKIFDLVREADTEGLCVKLYLEALAIENKLDDQRFFYTDQLLASLMKPKAAEWLIARRDLTTRRSLARFLTPEIRNILRPHSDGIIEQLEKNTDAYLAERAAEQDAQKRQITLLQQRLLEQTEMGHAIDCFLQLKEDNWPEIPKEYKYWITTEISALLEELDLGDSIVWQGASVSYPELLPALMKIIHHYELKLEPDVPIVFCTTAWYSPEIADYYRKFGFSAPAVAELERLLTSPKSQRGLSGTIGFLRASGCWSQAIGGAIENIVRNSPAPDCRFDALSVFVTHPINVDFLAEVAHRDPHEDTRQLAFKTLVKMQHRPTIERSLSELLEDPDELKSSERWPPLDMTTGWINLIRSDFAFEKLANLRKLALKMELPGVVGIVTEALVQINRSRAASVIKHQLKWAPESWKRTQQIIAIEQERTARVESVQNSPFEEVLRKLRRSTTLRRLKLVCEGKSDVVVFRQLLTQIPDMPDIEFDFAGGWPNLERKDPSYFQHGCHEAIVVMDGDEGRNLRKARKPLTEKGRTQTKRLASISVNLLILERYGIENYFPQHALERVVGKDLSVYFPIPHYVPVVEWLQETNTRWNRFKRFLVFQLRFPLRFSGLTVYRKDQNEEAAKNISLDQDLKGTDLANIIQEVAQRAKDLAC